MESLRSTGAPDPPLAPVAYAAKVSEGLWVSAGHSRLLQQPVGQQLHACDYKRSSLGGEGGAGNGVLCTFLGGRFMCRVSWADMKRT